MGYYEALSLDECCYTCQNNRNKLTANFPCNCQYENHNDNTSQDMWCGDYEMCEEYND
jgi:hypothetical protein